MKRILCLTLSIVTFLISGCSFNSRPQNVSGLQKSYQSYTEIPGVTPDEISALEKLLEDKPTLIYGMCASTEAFIRSDGSVGGFSELLCNRLSELFGFEFEIYTCGWNELNEKIVSKEIDFSSDFTANPERLKKFTMTDVIVQRTVKIFTDSRSESLKDIAKMRPIKCAFLEGSTTYSSISESWNLPFEPVFIGSQTDVPRLMLDGEIDAFIEEGTLEAGYDEYAFIKAEDYYPLTYSPVSMTTGNPELKPIIDVVQKYLNSGGYQELTELYNQGYKDYLKNKLSKQFTKEEREYIQNHIATGLPILAACETDNYPTSFYNTKEKEFQGIALDTLNSISELTGLTFQVGNAPNALWEELIIGLEYDEYSICSELLWNSQREGRFLWADKPYCSNSYALLSKTDYPDIDINQIPFSRIGLMKVAGHTDVFLEWFPDSANTAMYYSGTGEAFEALEKGEIDLLMANQNMLLNLTNYQEKPGFKANVIFNYSSDSFFGFNKNEEILTSIVNKALSYSNTEEITAHWQRKVFDYQSKMLKDMIPYAAAFTIVLILALIVVLVLFLKNRRINKNLDKTVRLRTNELESQAATLERRLEQQNLMAKLSQNFISGGNIDGQITKSLELVGEFLNLSRTLLLKYDEQSLNYLYEWDNPAQNIKSKLGFTLPISEMEMHLVDAYSQRAMAHFSLDDTDREDLIRRYQLDDLENFLMIPIYAEDKFWGVLEFDKCETYSPWTPSDIDLGDMIAGVLSGVMSRRKIEGQLVQLSSIVESSPQLITIVLDGGGVEYINPAASEITGYSEEEILRGGLSLILDSGVHKRLKEEILPAINENNKQTYELPIIKKDGETRILSVSAFNVASEKGGSGAIASDITDLVRMQKELEHRTAELALQTSTLTTIFESIPDLVFCKDANSVYTRCNPSLEKFLGMSEAEVVGKSDAEIFNIDAEMAKLFVEADQKVLDGQKAEKIEELVTYPDGTQRMMETIKTPLIQDNEVIGMMGISRDITERKAAEETLKLTLDNLDACVYITEIDTGEILFMNKRMAEEYKDADCVGKKCWETLQKGFTERCDFCPVPNLIESGDKDYVWEEHSTLTGKHYKNTDSLIKWNDGRLVHMQHSVDISDIKEAQSALNKRLRQQSLMSFISQSFLTDADADSLVINALRITGEFLGIAQILCYKLEEDGKALTCENEWIDPSIGLQTRIGEKLTIEGPMTPLLEKMSQDMEFCLSSNDPSIKAAMAPYRLNFQNYITTPLYLNDKLYGVLDFSKRGDGTKWSESDINLAVLVSSLLSGFLERHFMETELITAKELAEQGSRSKSDFLSRMSHEIRTPLNAIIGMVNIAMGTADNEKTKDCLAKADNASKHLLGIINDILDMSKIEADKFVLDHREFNFENMLMNVTNVINFRVEEKNQDFIVNLNGNVPEYIIGDGLRLSQVITNLLTNAVKFTPEGGTINLNIDKIEDSGNEITLKVEVEDNGIGISEEQQKRLFTSFEQADGGIARKFGGTGLGLAISKSIVELMGGQIWIESEMDKGSKFIFTMKAGKGKGTANAKLSEKINRDDMRILAVDDSPEIREYFMRVMQSLGLPCNVASSGVEAVDMVKNYDGKPYNIFFIDWQMPEMDGIELTKMIKGIAPDNSVVFMISVSEWGTIEKEALEVGVRSFISKPLFPSTLVNAINECIEIKPKKTEAVATESQGFNRRTFDEHTILLVEDVEINREIMYAILEETGMSIDYAENGLMAVSMFKDNPDKYSLVLMDIHMPEMDGYEATRTIRALELPRAKHVPIIAMTANVFREDIENCLAAGMNNHIGKPVDRDDLFSKLELYLR